MSENPKCPVCGGKTALNLRYVEGATKNPKWICQECRAEITDDGWCFARFEYWQDPDGKRVAGGPMSADAGKTEDVGRILAGPWHASKFPCPREEPIFQAMDDNPAGKVLEAAVNAGGPVFPEEPWPRPTPGPGETLYLCPRCGVGYLIVADDPPPEVGHRHYCRACGHGCGIAGLAPLRWVEAAEPHIKADAEAFAARFIDPCSIPSEVQDAAAAVAQFFVMRSESDWQLGGLCSRSFADRAEKAEAALKRVTEALRDPPEDDDT